MGKAGDEIMDSIKYLIFCRYCNWRGNKYMLIISPNGVKCPECRNHFPQTEDGWISIKNGLPEDGGFYEVLTPHGQYEAPFSFTQKGVGKWVVPDESIITHWRYKTN